MEVKNMMNDIIVCLDLAMWKGRDSPSNEI